MQLKQRIKKIEEALALNDTGSATCECWEKHWRSALKSVYNDDPEIKIEVYPSPDFEKGYCDKCQKPISKNDIEMCNDIVEAYGEKEIEKVED